uniref:Uncharacterized protein n=1 Tax=Chromera velia CCMP2878 TaxID=1169474 RepID=A0A0G4ID07_9ALVE|mmetsp:Transcript_11118/g.21470  ORF Transcript_11118/g.21470 Transcript_11118/m.21470 type:complete len:356 (+) Transcript_11118:237-1304(+)|eukprot:Cvel_2313.t1-p1 / transcript=Cvel_2313.t1 / gene=Cvel_2313 / organism=Chromera_velia_CCMP2878 / gene_product=Peroxisomal adenine nucleotide carrier 2, putative / transcript_product=Peroxisomal adenine nucleotide carrier 2, putative / location=Cvel_scaffold89:80664-81728(-) / protein_length=355 / sequence_SO=supercontig / SO=protein_coding / is_pseudo=false
MESFIDASAGGVAGVVSAVSLYPLSVLLTRYQTRRGQKTNVGLQEVFWALWREDPGAFVRGLRLKVFETLIRNFVYFYIYAALKKAYERRVGPLRTSSTLAVATLSAMLNQTMTAPLEMLTTLVQTSEKDLGEMCRDIYKKEGLPGFYRGFKASMILCSNPAITNASFDRLKFAFQVFKLSKMAAQAGENASDEVSVYDEKLPDLTDGESFLIGAVAKAIATVITYPYIRAKVLQQHMLAGEERERKAARARSKDADSLTGPPSPDASPRANPEGPPSPVGGSSSRAPKELLPLLLHTWAKEGVGGIFRGLQLQLFKTVLASALMFMMKERIYRITRAGFKRLGWKPPRREKPRK